MLPVRPAVAVFVLALSSSAWGLTWLPIKAMAEQGLHSLHMVAISFIAGSLVLLPAMVWQYRQWRPHFRWMLGLVVAGAVGNACFQSAIAYGEVVRVMILFYLLPVWSVLGGRFLLRERSDGLRLFAVALCLLGASLTLGIWEQSWSQLSWIDLLALLAGMGFAATNLLFRHVDQAPVTSKVGFVFIGCALFMSALVILFPPASPIPSITVGGYAALYGALWLTLITFGTQWAVTYLPAGRAAVIIVMELVVATISSAILLHKGFTTIEMVGITLVLAAAILEGARAEAAAPEVSAKATA